MPVEILPKLITTGVIAAHLGQPVERVTRVLNTRPHIKPVARAGNVRLYEGDAIALVRHELTVIDARRTAGGAA